METIEVSVIKLFRGCPKPDGWFGAICIDRDTGDRIKLTGKCHFPISNGTNILCRGDFDDNSAYEDDFKAVSIELVLRGRTAIVNYLSSGHFKGIGKVTAGRIYDAYGDSTMRMLYRNLDKVKEDINLTKEQVEALQQGLMTSQVERELLALVPTITPAAIRYMQKVYRDDAVNILKSDPYVLLDVPGLGFKAVDDMAVKYLNVGLSSDKRIANGVCYILKNFDGSMYLDLTNGYEWQYLKGELYHILGLVFEDNDLQVVLDRLSHDYNKIIVAHEFDSYHLYDRSVYEAQKQIKSAFLHNAGLRADVTGNVLKKAKDFVSHYVSDGKVQFYLNDDQKKAVMASFRNRYSVITGGPGRGKTAVVDCLCKLWRHMYPTFGDVVLLAPTGKAVRKMENAAKGEAAYTLAKFLVSKEARSESPNILYVVDEMSMVGIVDTAKFMHLAEGNTVVFVGDNDQLPPIAAGSFFYDLVSSGAVAVSYLTKNMRSNKQALSDNADKVRMGDTKLVFDPDSFLILPQAADDENASNTVVTWFMDHARTTDPGEIAVLTPMRKGILGSTCLNAAIQDAFNRKNENWSYKWDNKGNYRYLDTTGAEIPGDVFMFWLPEKEKRKYRIGDRVMHLDNMTDKAFVVWKDNDPTSGVPVKVGSGVYNGDTGKILRYIPKNDPSAEDTLIIQLDDGRTYEVSEDEFIGGAIGMAYAYTVHKAQGSEYDHVLCVVPDRLLYTPKGFASRNLLYTAITRARESVVMIGSKRAMDMQILTDGMTRRSVLGRYLVEGVKNSNI